MHVLIATLKSCLKSLLAIPCFHERHAYFMSIYTPRIKHMRSSRGACLARQCMLALGTNRCVKARTHVRLPLLTEDMHDK